MNPDCESEMIAFRLLSAASVLVNGLGLVVELPAGFGDEFARRIKDLNHQILNGRMIAPQEDAGSFAAFEGKGVLLRLAFLHAMRRS